MKRSLLALVFQSLHARAAPVLWHTDCVRSPVELRDLLATRVLAPTTDATTLPASRSPAPGLELKVRKVGETILGINHDSEDPVEIELTPESVKRYKIEIAALTARLRQTTGLRGGISTRFDDGLLNLGERPDSEVAVRVYLAAPITSGEDLLARCRRLHALHPTRRIDVLTFCPVALDVSLEEEFERRLGFSLHSLRDAEGNPAWAPVWPGQSAPTAPLDTADYVFRRLGADWQIVFAGHPVTVNPKLDGLLYLRYLVANPDEPISVEELMATVNPHPDQVGRDGRITVLASAKDDLADEKMVKNLKHRRSQIRALLPKTPVERRGSLINEAASIEKNLRASMSALRKSGKEGESKRASVAQAIRRAIGEMPSAMREHFKPPRLRLGYKPCYHTDNHIDWLT